MTAVFGKLFNQTNLIQKSLDASWYKNEVIAQNIANVDTPGYKSKSVSFDEEFRAALQSEEAKALPRTGVSLRDRAVSDSIRRGPELSDRLTASRRDPLAVQPTVYQNNTYTMKMDGNNVDVESELNEAGKNTLYYYTMLNKITSEMGRIKTAIRDIR